MTIMRARNYYIGTVKTHEWDYCGLENMVSIYVYELLRYCLVHIVIVIMPI